MKFKLLRRGLGVSTTVLHVMPIVSWVSSVQYGDSFTEDATEDSLRAVFKKVEEKVRW